MAVLPSTGTDGVGVVQLDMRSCSTNKRVSADGDKTAVSTYDGIVELYNREGALLIAIISR